MAQIGQTRTITDREGGSWQIYGNIDTDSGAKTLILYGSSGQIIKQGSAADIINLVKQLPSTGPEDFFIQDVISAARELDISLSKSTPPPPQDSAQSQVVNNTPAPQIEAGTTDATDAELANLKNNKPIDKLYTLHSKSRHK